MTFASMRGSDVDDGRGGGDLERIPAQGMRVRSTIRRLIMGNGRLSGQAREVRSLIRRDGASSTLFAEKSSISYYMFS